MGVAQHAHVEPEHDQCRHNEEDFWACHLRERAIVDGNHSHLPLRRPLKSGPFSAGVMTLSRSCGKIPTVTLEAISRIAPKRSGRVIGGSGSCAWSDNAAPSPEENAFCIARQTYATPAMMPKPTNRANTG